MVGENHSRSVLHLSGIERDLIFGGVYGCLFTIDRGKIIFHALGSRTVGFINKGNVSKAVLSLCDQLLDNPVAYEAIERGIQLSYHDYGVAGGTLGANVLEHFPKSTKNAKWFKSVYPDVNAFGVESVDSVIKYNCTVGDRILNYINDEARDYRCVAQDTAGVFYVAKSAVDGDLQVSDLRANVKLPKAIKSIKCKTVAEYVKDLVRNSVDFTSVQPSGEVFNRADALFYIDTLKKTNNALTDFEVSFITSIDSQLAFRSTLSEKQMAVLVRIYNSKK